MKILKDYPLAKECTFNLGGRARWFCAVENMAEFKNLLSLHKGRLYILGGGSKTLCKDEGYEGLVISTKKLSNISFDGELVACEAGVSFDALKNFCIEHSLSGLEWTAGIPASVGGAVVMNCGSFGHEFSESVQKVEIFENGRVQVLPKTALEFSYRNSSLKAKAVLRVWLKLEKAEGVKKGFQEFLNKKTALQPKAVGSVGSIFKRSGDVIPAKLIDKLGLKGVKIGQAEVSTLHSGFIINRGGATATDVLALIDLIKKTVYDKCGVVLENEVIVLE